MDSSEQAQRIKDLGTALDYEQEALNGIQRSWEREDRDCQALALADAQVYATLELARATRLSSGLDPAVRKLFSIVYTNHRGETARRTIEFRYMWFGVTKWHPKPQFLLHALDIDKQQERDFAIKDIKEWVD